MSVTLLHTDVRNDEGQSPLDLALEHPYNDNCIDVALYLINHGCGDDKDKDKLLCGACRWGRLDVVKELVEKHDRDPNGECRVQLNLDYPALQIACFNDIHCNCGVCHLHHLENLLW